MQVEVDQKNKRITIIADTDQDEDNLDACLKDVTGFTIFRTYDAGANENQMGIVVSGNPTNLNKPLSTKT